MRAPIIRDHMALHALIDSHMRTGFAWGSHDCVTFAAEAARVQTGTDYRKRFGVRWSTAKGAARALAAKGGIAAAVDAVLTRVAPAHAHRGDIGLLTIEGRESLVVIEGELVVGPGLAGLVRAPRGALAAAWTLAG